MRTPIDFLKHWRQLRYSLSERQTGPVEQTHRQTSSLLWKPLTEVIGGSQGTPWMYHNKNTHIGTFENRIIIIIYWPFPSLKSYVMCVLVNHKHPKRPQINQSTLPRSLKCTKNLSCKTRYVFILPPAHTCKLSRRCPVIWLRVWLVRIPDVLHRDKLSTEKRGVSDVRRRKRFKR